MAKAKNKKRISSDQIHKKREAASKSNKPMNPFEVHVNKEKIRVLGKKLKNDRGLPGISRAKAINKRKHTLLKEYKLQNKSNKFTDRRIGERNHSMTDEDKITARFAAAAVKAKSHNRKSIYNLADDEILTHQGQTLSEAEKFDDPRSDDEMSDEEIRGGNLDKEFVGDAHFGGGILKKTGKEGAKTHKELIEQLIEESKKRKAEKQKIKEATLELTEKLDTEWKDLMPLINTKKNSDEIENTEREKIQVNDYDKVMRELRFEARGTVSDRLKSEDEIAKEEKERLEELERDRVERMKGFTEETNVKQNHRSADDLDDDFVYDDEPNEEYTLSYNEEGKSNVKLDLNVDKSELSDNEETNDNNSDVDEESEELETDSEDNLSDLKESSESENEDEEIEETKNEETKIEETTIEESSNNIKRKLQDNNTVSTQIKKQKIDNDSIKNDLLERKKIMEKAREELPFTFPLPDSYESLIKLLENHSSTHQNIIIERIIKCNHPSLSEGNKEGLSMLFAYLLQYLNDLFAEENVKSLKKSFDIFKELAPKIYELAQLNPENAHNSMLEVIKEKQAEFRKHKKSYPGFEVLIFLKLVGLLFPTSDFRHQIVTPCFVFMEQMLTKCRVKSNRDILYGLFLVTIILEYTTLSKRYLPASINFLSGILHMAIPNNSVKLIKVVPPFKPISNNLVVLTQSCDIKKLKMQVDDFFESASDDEDFKVRTLYLCLLLLKDFIEHFKELSSNVEIFESAEKHLKQIPLELYPNEVKDLANIVLELLEKQRNDRKLFYIVMEAKKPKALRLYEPKFEDVFDFKTQRKGLSKQKAEKAKLLHKLKKETKGALREIRKDKEFLGRVKINQKIQSDKDRKEKVKRLFAEASIQQSELKTLDRMKSKKKK